MNTLKDYWNLVSTKQQDIRKQARVETPCACELENPYLCFEADLNNRTELEQEDGRCNCACHDHWEPD